MVFLRFLAIFPGGFFLGHFFGKNFIFLRVSGENGTFSGGLEFQTGVLFLLFGQKDFSLRSFLAFWPKMALRAILPRRYFTQKFFCKKFLQKFWAKFLGPKSVQRKIPSEFFGLFGPFGVTRLRGALFGAPQSLRGFFRLLEPFWPKVIAGSRFFAFFATHWTDCFFPFLEKSGGHSANFFAVFGLGQKWPLKNRRSLVDLPVPFFWDRFWAILWRCMGQFWANFGKKWPKWP